MQTRLAFLPSFLYSDRRFLRSVFVCYSRSGEVQFSRTQIEKVHAQERWSRRSLSPSCAPRAPLRQAGKNTRRPDGTRAPLPDTVNRFPRPPKLNGRRRTFLRCSVYVCVCVCPTCADSGRSFVEHRILRRHLRRRSSHLRQRETSSVKGRHATSSPSDRSRDRICY